MFVATPPHNELTCDTPFPPFVSLSLGWYFYLTLVALIASVIGDALLNLPLIFPLGVVSFGIAQILYAIIFGAQGFFGTSWLEKILLLVLVGGICLGIFLAIRRKLMTLFKEHFNIGIIVIIGLYFSMIATMLWTALLQHVAAVNVRSLLALAGGGLFFISDLCIVLSGIYSSHWFFKRRIVVMATYYVAQFLISTSVLFFCLDF